MIESVKSFVLVCLIFIEILCSAGTLTKNQPEVKTGDGTLRGSEEKAVQGFSYYSFKGIPYAQPPVGPLRFKAPLTPKPWHGTRDATKYGAACAQFNVTFVGSEDCLFLNVFTRSLDPRANLPVMVFVHGGSFAFGAANEFFEPEFLIQHDVILVTLNYRLEVLGFLSLDIPEAPGNAGMKDQVAALKWVQQNIKQFGGNPNSVTLFGESSGAGAVTYHMLSPMSKGLFHKVIAESGNCMQDWAISQDSIGRALRAGKVLGKDTNNVNELLDFFMSLKASALTNLTEVTLTEDEMYRGVPARFVPAIESKFRGIEPFITEHPVMALTKGRINSVPLMIGYNAGEGIALVAYHIAKLDGFNRNPSYYIQKEIVNKVSEAKLKEFGDRVQKFYVGDRNMTADDGAIIRDLQTDITFAYSGHRFASLHSEYEKVYFYKFNFVTDLNVIKATLPDLEGATHGDELFYLFSNYITSKIYQNPKIKVIVDKVTKLWANFAKCGSPTPDNKLGVSWPRYTRHNKEYLNIADNFPSGRYADRERMEFWNNIYKEAGLPHIAS
ncbi:carboxylesterase 4A-like [Aricia agestis]|uniref:carboxylesterase 4A-like n=1 Tax=Aricia agestis TaxID=91739 RepID=UPI001C208470|nr:carboxylesterase 4A-like [Aricia agestis]